MTRRPDTPDCDIRGCTRAVYRAGMCRQHHERLPLTDRLAAAADNMRAMHEAGQAYRAATVAKVQALVDAEG